MSHQHVVEIQTGAGPGATKIFLDGAEVKGIRRFRLEQTIDQWRPKLTLELHPLKVTVDGKEVDVAMYKPKTEA